MDTRRFVLFAALGFVSLNIINAWQHDVASKQIAPSLEQSEKLIADKSPPIKQSMTETDVDKPLDPTKKLIKINTDVLDLSINLRTGNINDAALVAYPVSLEEKKTPYPLLTDDPAHAYSASSDLFTVLDNKIHALSLAFDSDKSSYTLAPNQKSLVVNLFASNEQGLSIVKKITLLRSSYLISVEYSITNKGKSPWVGYLNTQLSREAPEDDKTSFLFHVGSYTGASYSNPEVHRYKKVSFNDMKKQSLDVDVRSGWIAMQQRYFVTAWIPVVDAKNKFYTRSPNGKEYIIGSVSDAIHVNPDEIKNIEAKLYVGPEVASKLSQAAPGLDLTIDYGWLWLISSFLFSLMRWIHQWVGNWGWTIVLVTAVVKLAFYRLSATSYRSMAAMRELQPKVQALRERYGDDKAKISQATMELYRQEKVNPLAGCLPVIVQLPVMIGLYWVMIESVELRQAPFIFWIHDLALPDPWHILPIIMCITVLIQQYLNPTPSADPTLAKTMMVLPFVFAGLCWNFPAGIVLYWSVSNTLTAFQQWYLIRNYTQTKK